MKTTFLAAFALILVIVVGSTLKAADETYIKVEVKGKLETGKVAIGGETTGTTITANGAGSSITYHAQIQFHGLAKLATPFLQSEFEGLGDETAEKITTAINSL